MINRWIATGAVGAALSVILGAFGAHGLESRLPAAAMHAFETGVHYQFLHALGLILVGSLLPAANPPKTIVAAAWFMLTGTLLFSGSLYLLAITGIRGIGIVTPLGGLALIVAWLLLAVGSGWRQRRSAR
jgi:uncharacterized membrane protein YgdD (TMEM256/DUF423 family)